MSEPKLLDKQRLTYSEKNRNNKAWYKEQINSLDEDSTNNFFNGNSGVSEYKRKKVNYDLFNNILDLSDFEYVCKPFGAESGELPAQMINRDISSSRIKAVLGLEMKRPFTWKALATNREATTRKEEVEYGKIREFVIAETMNPIMQQIEIKYQEKLKGGDLTPDEKRKIQEQIQEETKSATPDKVRKYMERDHQDPSEVLANQIINYLIQDLQLKRKFNQGFKHGLLSSEEVYWCGILNGKPEFKVINPIRFNYDRSPDIDFIEDGEYASYEYRMAPSTIIKYFGKELTDKQIDKIYSATSRYSNSKIRDEMFIFGNERDTEFDHNTNRVLHAVWKGLRKIGFLTYIDEDGEEQEQIIDESYKLDLEKGDISIEWEWIPEVYEGYKIDSDIFVSMQPIPGQFKDLNNLYRCPLPYSGVVYDDMNSKPTSLMDRMKVYQYYYNIVMYRLELLMASDKGKKVLMNINAIPESSGIDIEKWQYFFESTPFAWFDPSEEGNEYSDVNSMAKVLDLSVVSDIAKYIDLAEFLEQKCGKSVGITDAVIGEVAPSQEVGNTKQAIVQTSNILEPYFELHNSAKRNALQYLIEVAEVAYSEAPPESLAYILDDMSVKTLNSDIGLLTNNTIGIFASDGSVDAEVKETLKSFTHAALQNQKAELSDAISIIRQKDSQEAEEILKAAEKKRIDREDRLAKENNEFKAQEAEKMRQEDERRHERDKELIVLKEEEKRKTDVLKQTILSLGFNEDKDMDQDGVPDVLEIARDGVNAEIKMRKQKLDENKFEQGKKEHKDKMSLESKKIAAKNTN